MDDDNNFKVTIDHQMIRMWAEAHRGKPEILEDQDTDANTPILRLDFPGKRDDVFLGDNLGEKKIGWDEFFKKFDEQDLAFMYEDIVEKGADASFSYKFVKRDEIIK